MYRWFSGNNYEKVNSESEPFLESNNEYYNEFRVRINYSEVTAVTLFQFKFITLSVFVIELS